MQICGRYECQTTAGCAHRGPNGQLCYWEGNGSCAEWPGWYIKFGRLSDFTDNEIAAEWHRRALQKLGDQRIGYILAAGD